VCGALVQSTPTSRYDSGSDEVTTDHTHGCHAPLHRQRLVVAFEWVIFVVELGNGAVVVTGAGGQEHRQPLRRARDGVVDLHQRARHTGLRRVRDEGGAEEGGDADEDEGARGVHPFLVGAWRQGQDLRVWCRRVHLGHVREETAWS